MTQVVLIAMISLTAQMQGFPVDVALAVAQQESNLNPKAIGALGERGIYQIRPQFHKEYTVKQLEDPLINIEVGINYLSKMKHECYHRDNINYLVCWNGGPQLGRRVKHPELFPYVVQVKKRLANNN